MQEGQWKIIKVKKIDDMFEKNGGNRDVGEKELVEREIVRVSTRKHSSNRRKRSEEDKLLSGGQYSNREGSRAVEKTANLSFTSQ